MEDKGQRPRGRLGGGGGRLRCSLPHSDIVVCDEAREVLALRVREVAPVQDAGGGEDWRGHLSAAAAASESLLAKKARSGEEREEMGRESAFSERREKR